MKIAVRAPPELFQSRRLWYQLVYFTVYQFDKFETTCLEGGSSASPSFCIYKLFLLIVVQLERKKKKRVNFIIVTKNNFNYTALSMNANI